MRTYQRLLVGNLRQVFVEHHLIVHHRTYLQQIEHPRTVGIQLHGKFYLHLAAHALTPKFQNQPQKLRKGKHPLLQHAAEGDEFTSSVVNTVANHHVVRVVRGSNELQRTVLFGFLDRKFQQVETVVHPEILLHGFHFEGIKPRLRLAQGYFHLARLQHLVGMGRTDAQVHAAVHDVFPQPECKVYRAVFGLFVPDGVVVHRTGHTGDVRVETVTVTVSGHFLKNHRHFFLVDDVARGRHIRLAVAVEHRSVYPLDGIAQHLQPHVTTLHVRYHIGGVYPGKRLVMGIFEQGRGTDGYGLAHDIEIGLQVADQAFGQPGLQECTENLFVRNVRKRNLVKFVRVHELVKDIRTEHHRFGYHDIRVVERVQFRMLLDDVVQKSQATPFSAQRPFTDTCEIAETVETVAVEHGYHALVLHPAVAHNRVIYDLTMGIHVLERTPCDMFQELGYGEQCPRAQPTRHVVARNMIKERFLGQSEDIVLKVFQVLDARHLFHRVRVEEDKISETEMPTYQTSQVDPYLLGILVDKMRPALLGPSTLISFRRLHNQRHELVFGTDGRQ